MSRLAQPRRVLVFLVFLLCLLALSVLARAATPEERDAQLTYLETGIPERDRRVLLNLKPGTSLHRLFFRAEDWLQEGFDREAVGRLLADTEDRNAQDWADYHSPKHFLVYERDFWQQPHGLCPGQVSSVVSFSAPASNRAGDVVVFAVTTCKRLGGWEELVQMRRESSGWKVDHKAGVLLF